ncbi:MAG: riboflavin biosynthesis protein RibF [Clostridia bacterium]|nr:riboflavin biosynthesis protein RibF [Clostridia bacterium]
MSENQNAPRQPVAAALGNFDGLHIGHATVIEAAVRQEARGFDPVVLKFREHPMRFFPGGERGLILTDEEDGRRIESLGARVEYLDFSAVRGLSPAEFIDGVLLPLGVRFVSCGYNYRFGKNAAGDAGTLKELCEKRNIEVCVCGKVEYHGTAVSSTAIREALKDGDIPLANAMLGYRYGYCFEVVHGDARGRALGAPTANQFFPPELLTPRYGVYVSSVEIGGRSYPGVTNIGIRPTVGGEARSETHIVGFDGDLYGSLLRVEPIRYLREERRFASLEELSAQIARDKAQSLEIFNGEVN